MYACPWPVSCRGPACCAHGLYWPKHTRSDHIAKMITCYTGFNSDECTGLEVSVSTTVACRRLRRCPWACQLSSMLGKAVALGMPSRRWQSCRQDIHTLARSALHFYFFHSWAIHAGSAAMCHQLPCSAQGCFLELSCFSEADIAHNATCAACTACKGVLWDTWLVAVYHYSDEY